MINICGIGDDSEPLVAATSNASVVPAPCDIYIRVTGGVITNKERPRFSERNLSENHFVHHKSHII
jgi:hypothetical protein